MADNENDNSENIDKSTEAWIKSLEKLASEQKRYGGNIKDVVNSSINKLKKLEEGTHNYNVEQQKLVKSLKKEFKDLNDGIKQGIRSQQDLWDATDELTEAIKHTTDSEEKRVLQDMKNAAARKAAEIELLEGLSKGMSKTIVSITSGTSSFVKSLQSGASSTEISAGLMNTAIDVAAAGATAVATGFKAAGDAASKSLNPWVSGIGSVVSGFASVSAASTEAASKLAKFGVDIASKEVEKTVKAFNSMSSAGAMFTDGMTGMRESSRGAGLTVDQFADVVKSSSASIGQSGLGVTEGAKQIGRVGKILKESGVQNQLLKLGYSFEEQAELTAQTIANMRRSAGGTVSDQAVAEQTQKYAENLRLIASITGEDAKKKVEQRRSENMELAFQQKTAKLSAEQRAQMDAATANMTDMEAKNFRERMVLGNVINREGAIYEATISGAREKGEEAVALANNNKLSAEATADLNAKYSDQIRKSSLSQEAIGRAAMLGKGNLEVTAKGMSDALQQSNTYTKDGVKKAKEQAKGQENATDKLTNSVMTAEQAAQNLKVALQDLLTPAIEKYVDISTQMLEGVKKLMKEMGLWKGPELPKTEPGKAYKMELDEATGQMVPVEKKPFTAPSKMKETVGPQKKFSEDVEKAIADASAANQVDAGYMRTMAKIESSGDPTATNKSGAKGLYQFVPGTAAQYGIKGREFDPKASADAAARMTRDNMKSLKRAGVEATPEMLYLAHQQGAGGATKLAKAAEKGLSWNQLDPELQKNMAANAGQGKSAQEFLDMWKNKYQSMAGDATQVAQEKPKRFKNTIGEEQPVATAKPTEAKKEEKPQRPKNVVTDEQPLAVKIEKPAMLTTELPKEQPIAPGVPTPQEKMNDLNASMAKPRIETDTQSDLDKMHEQQEAAKAKLATAKAEYTEKQKAMLDKANSPEAIAARAAGRESELKRQQGERFVAKGEPKNANKDPFALAKSPSEIIEKKLDTYLGVDASSGKSRFRNGTTGDFELRDTGPEEWQKQTYEKENANRDPVTGTLASETRTQIGELKPSQSAEQSIADLNASLSKPAAENPSLDQQLAGVKAAEDEAKQRQGERTGPTDHEMMMHETLQEMAKHMKEQTSISKKQLSAIS